MPSTPKLNPAIFLQAASIVAKAPTSHRSSFACNAIKRVRGHGSTRRELDYFVALLKPTIRWGSGVGPEEAWYEPVYESEACPLYSHEHCQTARMLGLILCSILVKEGFKPSAKGEQ